MVRNCGFDIPDWLLLFGFWWWGWFFWSCFYLFEDVLQLLIDRLIFGVGGAVLVDEVLTDLQLLFDVRRN